MKRLVILTAYGLLIPWCSYATVWQVPSQCPTVQAGIDSASAGDTVSVACGTYHEHDIVLKSGVLLQSDTGDASCVTIDAEWQGRVFVCENLDTSSTISGFTVMGGFHDLGAGMWCLSSTVTVSGCVFRQNTAYHGGGMACFDSYPTLIDCTFNENYGDFGPGGLYCSDSPATLVNCSFIDNGEGAMYCSSSSATLVGCVFSDNWSWDPGGGLTLNRSSSVLTNCTFYANTGVLGGAAIYLASDNTLLVQNTIIAFSSHGEAILCRDGSSQVTLECCDVFGNAGGDWVGCISGQLGINGNISADPHFCDPENGDLGIQSDSPCAPDHHPSGHPCGLIGARDTGCDSSAANRTTWGGVKALYRQKTP